MSKYSKREVAIIAELLADKLIQTYRNEQIPAMVDGFASAGFTQMTLKRDPVRLFQMVLKPMLRSCLEISIGIMTTTI